MACTGLGRCKVALWFAVVLDILGLIALLVGIFAKLQREGRDFGDLLIYTGAIVVFVSLIGWVFWYTGNIEISWEELESDYQLKDNRLNRIVRKISRPTYHVVETSQNASQDKMSNGLTVFSWAKTVANCTQ
uniref:Transmembrane protein 238a n=1 Tax=Callorhinchus milii TaxID=7868 RepID=A0A4W3IAW4_CALMI